MQLTKFTHACVRFDDGDRALVIDPGAFSEVEAALDGAQAVLITHEHPDHIDVDQVTAALEADPRLRLYAPSAVTAMIGGRGGQVVTVETGQEFDAGGFAVRAFGGQHALIHPEIPMIANLGYLVEGAVFHPGDSFTVPAVQVQTLLAPTSAPWSKASEIIDFVIAVRAPQVFQVHDVLATPMYANIVEQNLQRIAGPHGVTFTHLDRTQTVTV